MPASFFPATIREEVPSHPNTKTDDPQREKTTSNQKEPDPDPGTNVNHVRKKDMLTEVREHASDV